MFLIKRYVQKNKLISVLLRNGHPLHCAILEKFLLGILNKDPSALFVQINSIKFLHEMRWTYHILIEKSKMVLYVSLGVNISETSNSCSSIICQDCPHQLAFLWFSNCVIERKCEPFDKMCIKSAGKKEQCEYSLL